MMMSRIRSSLGSSRPFVADQIVRQTTRLADHFTNLLHQRRLAVIGHAQLLTRAGHCNVEQSAGLHVAAPLQFVYALISQAFTT